MFGYKRMVVTDVDERGGSTSTGGMPTPGGVSQEMPTNVSNDAEPKSGEVEVLRTQLAQRELDLRKLQSSLQSGFDREKKRLQEQMEQLQNQMVAKMDDEERRAFEADKVKRENAELREQLESLRIQQEQARTMQDWVSYFSEEFGISTTELDMSSPEAMIQSGLDAAARKVKGVTTVQSHNRQLPKRPASDQPIITGSNGQPSIKPTPDSIRKSISDRLGRPITWDEFYSMAERGQVDLSQIG